MRTAQQICSDQIGKRKLHFCIKITFGEIHDFRNVFDNRAKNAKNLKLKMRAQRETMSI